MKKIFFISPHQYGYHTDMDMYCKYLCPKYKIDFLCYYEDKELIKANATNVIYLKKPENKLLRNFLLAVNTIRYIYRKKPDYVFIKYFLGCSIILFFCGRKNIIVDIRTGIIDKSEKRRNQKDRIMSYEANKFKHISIISEGLRDKLKIDKRKSFILPLGADKTVESKKCITISKDKFYLIYVGTFSLRNIEQTIIGFNLFLNKYKDKTDCRYTIIGYSDDKSDERKIIDTINENNLNDYVSYVGRIPNNKLKNYFETHNIGVSYVPITDYFQHQPPTKTFEYICNGLICIATNTIENAKIIDDKNGILINEGSEEFFNGLEYLYNNIEKYKRDKIIEDSDKYSWKNVVYTYLEKYLSSI